MGSRLYADRLAHAGIATLAFDHRGFGESGGRRGHEDSQSKLADLRSAVGLLSARTEVDPSGRSGRRRGGDGWRGAEQLLRHRPVRVAAPGEQGDLDCDRHVGLYDVQPYVGQAVSATSAFLHRVL